MINKVSMCLVKFTQNSVTKSKQSRRVKHFQVKGTSTGTKFQDNWERPDRDEWKSVKQEMCGLPRMQYWWRWKPSPGCRRCPRSPWCVGVAAAADERAASAAPGKALPSRGTLPARAPAPRPRPPRPATHASSQAKGRGVCSSFIAQLFNLMTRISVSWKFLKRFFYLAEPTFRTFNNYFTECNGSLV